MHEFRVWAPTPRRVELVVANGTFNMSTGEMSAVQMCKQDGGWWSLVLDHSGPGTRYGFSLDGGPHLVDLGIDAIELLPIAECDLNDPRFVRSRDAGGYGFASAWADEWHHALHAALTNDRTGYYEDFGTLTMLAKALRQAWVYDGIWSQHRQRRHGRSPAGLAGHQFVVCTQNHDQVGNRAAGERSSALMSEGRMRVAAALLLTGPFTPMVFHGEEWGANTPFQYFTDHRDPDLAAAVSRGRRDEFANLGWDPDDVPDPQDVETYHRSKLDWHETEEAAHAAVLAWYRELIALRRQIPALSDPQLDRNQVDVDEHRATIEVTRGPVKVIVNLVVPPDTVAVVQVGDG